VTTAALTEKRFRSRVAVLRHDMYRLLFSATLVSGLGTWMATVALTVDIDRRTNSTWWVSGLFLVTFLPTIVIGLAAGPLVDRLSRKRLIVAADLVRLVVFALLPFAGSAAVILVLAGVAGVANSFFRPAVLAGVPNLIDESELAAGTSLLQATDWIATAAGPVIGGAIVSATGPHAVYWINAATFLFSAALLVRIPAGYLQSEQGLTRGHWRDLADGLAAFRAKALRVVLVAFGFTMVATGLINVTEIFLATRSLDSNAFGYGLLWTASGVGLVLGSLFTSVLLEHRKALDVYPLVFLPWAAGALGAAVSPNIWTAALAMVLAGFGNGLTFPMTVVIVQQSTSDAVRGRAFTVIISIHNALLGLAMLAAGELAASVGARWTYGLASAFLVSGAATAFALSRGRAA
jgi:MFS family permease